ncbi:MAG: hypothetical protein ACT4PU_09190 [Planctomycetota bacterium]
MFRSYLPHGVSRPLSAALVVLALLVPQASALQDPHGEHAHPAPPAAAKTPAPEFKGDPYLLATDPVSGKPLGPIESQVIIEHEGRELRFASPGNADAFKTEPGKFLPGVDAQMIAQQKLFYPLSTCVVTGEALGSGGMEPVDLLYKNRLIRLCCKSCKSDFLKDPNKLIAKLEQAVLEKQRPAYILGTCVVSDEPLGGDMGTPLDIVVAHRLVRLCCKGCLKDFRKDPLKSLGKLGSTPVQDAKAHEHGPDGHGHGH